MVEHRIFNPLALGSNPNVLISEVSPSGKAIDFESITRRFDSVYLIKEFSIDKTKSKGVERISWY